MERSKSSLVSPEKTFTLEELLAREPFLQKAYTFAQEAHEGQFRADGTPYFTHCIAVTRILCEEWGITDPEKLAVGLLHDVPEDTDYTLDDIKEIFGNNIMLWVDGVTQFRSETGVSKSQKDKETIRKVFNRNLVEPYVGVVKLADRLHNMRTIQFMPPEKQGPKAQETLNVYSPLAESLGMWIVKRELENISFKYTDPANFARYSRLFDGDPRTKDRFIDNMVSYLRQIMAGSEIPGEVMVRKNSLVRLKDKKHPFNDINDVVSFRIAVTGDSSTSKRDGVYKMLGILRENFGDMEDIERFDDFFHTPKFNEYSAIQLTLNTDKGAIEIAITTDEKEDYNNWGVVSLLRKGESNLTEHALKLVFTPTGQVKFLSPSATGIDLAYLINKKMGAQAVAVEINGEVFPVSTVLPNGSDVKIISGPWRPAPDPKDLINSQPSTKKKAEKQFIEKQMQDEQAKGKTKVARIIAARGLLDLYDLTKLKEHSDKLGDLLNYLGSKRSLAILYRLVEYGVVTKEELNRQLDKYGITKKNLGITSILVQGTTDDKNLLNIFTSQISEHHGNIRYSEGMGDTGEGFKIKFLVEGLSKNSERKLRKAFRSHPKISKSVVV